MRNYQRSGLDNDLFSKGLTAHTEETDTHQYYLRWPVAFLSASCCTGLPTKEARAPEHSRSVKRQEDIVL